MALLLLSFPHRSKTDVNALDLSQHPLLSCCRIEVNGWYRSIGTYEQSFATDGANEQRGDYFLDSADRVYFFVEPAALDLTLGELKAKYCQDDDDGNINAIDHSNMVAGLHVQPGTHCHKYADSFNKIWSIFWLSQPGDPQSIGGAAYSHQDATFLHTTHTTAILFRMLAGTASFHLDL